MRRGPRALPGRERQRVRERPRGRRHDSGDGQRRRGRPRRADVRRLLGRPRGSAGAPRNRWACWRCTAVADGRAAVSANAGERSAARRSALSRAGRSAGARSAPCPRAGGAVPPLRRVHRPLPLREVRLALGRLHLRLEALAHLPGAADLLAVLPERPPRARRGTPRRARWSRSCAGRATGTPSRSAWNCMSRSFCAGAAVDLEDAGWAGAPRARIASARSSIWKAIPSSVARARCAAVVPRSMPRDERRAPRGASAARRARRAPARRPRRPSPSPAARAPRPRRPS